MTRRRLVLIVVAAAALAAPSGALAHPRTSTVALDYRIVLDRASRSLPGVSVSILDGDRSLRVRVRRGTVVVRGDLGEPMLRVTPRGSFANRASATAVAEKLVASGRGWKQVSSGSTYTWHEHRLAPPPYGSGSPGVAARLAIPATLDGRSVTIGGAFVRYARPSLWPWLTGAAVAGGVLAILLRRAPLRAPLVVALGALALLAGAASLIVFAGADSPQGRIAWAEIAIVAFLAAACSAALARVRGSRRVHLAGLLGVAAIAVSLESLGVFRHGVVVSLVSATLSRSLLAVALVAGAAAAVASFSTDDPKGHR